MGNNASLKVLLTQELSNSKQRLLDEVEQMDSGSKRFIAVGAGIAFVLLLIFWSWTPKETQMKMLRYKAHQKKLFLCVGELNQPTRFWSAFARESERKSYLPGYNLFCVGFPVSPSSASVTPVAFGSDSVEKALDTYIDIEKQISLIKGHDEVILCGYGVGNLLIKRFLSRFKQRENRQKEFEKITGVFLLGPELTEENLENWCYEVGGNAVSLESFKTITQHYKELPLAEKTFDFTEKDSSFASIFRLKEENFLRITAELKRLEESKFRSKLLESQNKISEIVQEHRLLQKNMQQVEEEKQKQEQQLVALNKEFNELKKLYSDKKDVLAIQELPVEGVLLKEGGRLRVVLINGEEKKEGDLVLEGAASIVVIKPTSILFFYKGQNIEKRIGTNQFNKLFQAKGQLTQQNTLLVKENQTLKKNLNDFRKELGEQEASGKELQKVLQEKDVLIQEKEVIAKEVEQLKKRCEAAAEKLANAEERNKTLTNNLSRLNENLKQLNGSKAEFQQAIQKGKQLSEENYVLARKNKELAQKNLKLRQSEAGIKTEVIALRQKTAEQEKQLLLAKQEMNRLNLAVEKWKFIKASEVKQEIKKEIEQAPPSIKVKLKDIPEANELYLQAQSALNETKTPFGAFVGAGQISEAKEKFHRVIDEYPQSTKAEPAAYYLGTIYFEENNKSRGAIEVLKKCLVFNPATNFDVRVKIAIIYEGLLEGKEARFWYREAINKGKTNEERVLAQKRLQELKE